MPKHRKFRKPSSTEPKETKEPPALLNWNQVIIQVIFFGGVMFLLQQFYASLGSYEAIKYNYTIRQSSVNEEVITVSVYRLGKVSRKNILFGFRLTEPENHQILDRAISRCESDCFSALFASRDHCGDPQATEIEKPNPDSEREIRFRELGADNIYDVTFRVAVKPGTSTAGKLLFTVVDTSAIPTATITKQREPLRLKDYLYLCRLEFLLIALCLVLAAVVLTHRLRIRRKRV